jgi:predicted dehydrogenase
MEKPVTATLEEAAALVGAVERSGVKTLVGHHRRYLAAVQEARNLLRGTGLAPLLPLR